MVSIIIINWNNLPDLKECLNSIRKISDEDYEIVIVDNGSTDGSISYLKKQKANFANFKLIQNETNLGFAEGNNIGFKKATGDLILFLNNDTIVDKNFLTPLISILKSAPEIGAVQPKILNYPKKEIIDSVGSYLLPTGFLYHLGHNRQDTGRFNEASEIFSMKGACMLFKREVIAKTGLFDKSYFAYFEETDLCHRVWLSGYKILFLPSSSIYHKGGQTAKNIQASFIQFHSYKNRIFTYLKNLEPGNAFKILLLHLLFCEIITLVYFFTLQFAMAYAIQKAIFWNLRNWKKIAGERRKIAKLRKVSDEEILPKISRTVKFSYYYHLFATSLAGYEEYK